MRGQLRGQVFEALGARGCTICGAELWYVSCQLECALHAYKAP
jgi:hypothetical protein